jgi:threonyl-tRNA synthetase
VTDNQQAYAEKVFVQLRDAGIRVKKDLRNEKLSFKIREAQQEKIPYMLIIGDQEMADGTVTPRFRTGKNLAAMIPEAFVKLVGEECAEFK